jgi:hypothetical protein
MNIFAQANRLVTNISKTECFPIHCDNISLDFLNTSNMVVSQFPCKYMGLPLHFKKPSRSMLQPLIQKIGNGLPRWKRNLLAYLDRELLVKTILSVMPTFFMIVFKMSKWAHYRIDRFRRSFLWRGKNPDRVNGGHCLVN